MSETPLLGLPLLDAAQAQKHVTHNEALLLLDAALHLAVASRSVATPPGAPIEGDRYLVAAAATGTWATHDGELAFREQGVWRFATPRTGWRVWVVDESKFLIFDGAVWRDLTAIEILQNMSLLGVNTSADTGNRLAVSSPAVLLTHAGSDHRLKINKQAAANTASLLYQTNYSGRAEMGLAGDDDFHVKVSADGSTWHEAVVIDRSTGSVSFPNTASPGLSDGDKGDISVASGVWSIDAGAVSSAKLGGDVTAAGKSMLTAANAAAQTALLDTATRSLKGLMSGNDKKKLDSRPYASLFDVVDASEWAAIQAGTSTLDVSGYIQAAIDAGVAIVVPEGTFMLGAAFKFRSGTAIRAMGSVNRTVFKALAAMTAPVLGDSNSLSGGTNVYAQSGILIDGITFDGAGRTLSSDAALLRLYSVDGLTLRNCTFRDQPYSLLAIGGCRDVSLSGLRFRNWGKAAVSAEGGPALWLGGNTVGGDDTPSSRIRAYDLDFFGGEWAAIYDFSADSEFFGVNIDTAKEGGFYYQGNWSGNTTADSQPRRHLYSNFNIKSVARKNISAAGLEIAGDSCVVSNFNISDCEDAGLKIEMLSRNVSVSDGNIWDTVKAAGSYGTYSTYGQITLIQAEDIVNHDVSITGVTVGRADVTPVAPYALRIFNSNTAGLYWQHLDITGNNFSHGFATAAISAQAGALDPADTVSAICENIGAADTLRPVQTHASIELGHASDTTLSRSSAGVLAVEGGIIPKENRANTFTTHQVIETTDNVNAALRITQLGTASALLVEDSANPDSTPFVVSGSGNLIAGYTSAPAIGGAAHLGNLLGQGSNYPLALGYTGNSALGAQADFVKSRAADWSTRGLVANNDVIGALNFAVDDGTDLASVAAFIRVEIDGAPAADDTPGRLVIGTTADGAAAATERLRINSAGAWGLSGANYGTSGQVLKSNGSASPPTWTTVSGGSFNLGLALSIPLMMP